MSDGLLIQTMQGILARLDQIDDIKDEIKEEYAQAKAAGYDKTALGVAIREIRGRDKADKPEMQERASIVELYLSTFDNAPRTYVHVPAREAGASPNPRREHAPATQEETHVDRSASAQPDSADGRPAIPSMPGDAGNGQGSQTDTTGQPSGAGTGSAVRTGAPVSEIEHQPARFPAERDPQSVQHGSDSEGGAGGDSPAFVAGSEQGSAEEPQARNEPVSEDIASGGAGVTARPETPTRKPYILRPHCLRPELCASYGSKHCGECERAAKAREDEEAALVPAFVRKTHDHITIGDQA